MADTPFDDRPSSDSEQQSGDTSIYAQLDELLAEGESDQITRTTARRMEDTFIAAFKARIRHVPSVPHPVEGSLYDINAEKELFREWDEREEAGRQLLRARSPATPKDMPQCRALQMTVNRKAIFGKLKPRVSVIAAAWSPLEAFAQDAVELGGAHASGIEALDWVIERALIHERPSVFHYVAICSTSGWDATMLDPLPQGANYVVALVEPKPPGWMVHASELWPMPLIAAIEPEDAGLKRQRVFSSLRTNPELQIAGGLVLIEELADIAVVPHDLALDVAYEFAREERELVVEKVQGSMIIRRKRS